VKEADRVLMSDVEIEKFEFKTEAASHLLLSFDVIN